MNSADVLDLLETLDAQQVHYWLDGGWGVDCLLEEQTRPHSDLDLVLPRSQLEEVRTILAGRNYAVIRDWLPTTMALRDHKRLEVDLHPVDATADGGGDQVLQDGSTWHYGPPVAGRIDGRTVKCAPADEQIAMHQVTCRDRLTSRTFVASSRGLDWRCLKRSGSARPCRDSRNFFYRHVTMRTMRTPVRIFARIFCL